MNTIYISLPMASVENTVRERYIDAVNKIKSNKELSNYEIRGPVNILDFTENGLKETRKHKYSWYMGRDIEVLLDCQAIYMTNGWENSKGCNAELAIAKIYGLKIYFAE